MIKDISVKKGWYMNCLTYFPLCNEKYYESADQFNLDRWIKYPTTGSQNDNPYIFLPFSAGPRNCIG